MGHSARRRAHLERMKKKARALYPHDIHASWANHLKGCSCPLCGNPRRYFKMPTLGELRFEEARRDV